MADVQANIGVNIDATAALAQLKNLQRQISVFNAEIARGGGKAAAAAAGMQQELVSSINATGQFSASMTRIKSTTESFTNALEKNKLTMGQTFRYAGASTKKFGSLFKGEFDTIEKVARERVKTIQTQYVKMGRDANGAIKAIAVRPLALDMDNLATRTAMAAQKQQILNQLLRQGSTNLLNWGKNTQWAGRQLMVGFTIPLTIFGGLAAKTFMDLEEQAIRFKRVYGDLFTTPQQANEAFDDMKNLGLEFTKFGVAVEKTIGLAASVAQMGMMGADLTAQVTEATRLAVLGGMEQEEALNTTISLTNAFGVAAEDLTGKINFLNAAENQTILSIQDFNEAVPRAGSVVAQLGGDVEDLAFFLTAMREGGIEASQGANALKTSLGRLVNPTARAREELMGYGIDVVNIVESNAGNLRQTVLDLGAALEQLDPLEKSRAIERLFGKFQFARMSALFNNIMDDGSQAATVLELINTNASELGALASKELGRVEESAATKFRSAVEQFQAALAPIGESFLKLVTPIVEFGAKVLNAFNNLNDGAKGFIVALLGIVGAVGPVLLMTVGLLANGIANIMKMFLGLQTVFQKLRGQSTELAGQTQYMSQEQLEAASVASSLNQSHANLAQTFTSEATAVQRLTTEYQKLVAAQRSSLGIPMRTTSSAAPGFAKGKKVPGYKDGVVTVPGPKGAGDIQPAMLAPGEAVIPAAMADKYGPLINAMIDGSIPGYAKGLTTGTGSPVASHVAGFDPRQLSSVIQRLADLGYTFETTLYRVTENADGLGITIDKTEGMLHELTQSGDLLMAGGASFSGTTVPETAERNAMYEATGIAGAYGNMDELFEQESVLLQAKSQNTESYQRHTQEIERLLAEAQEARIVLSQSNDQARTKLSFDKERARQAIAFGLVAKEGMAQDEAEIEAGRRVEQAEELYARQIQEGVSEEQALSDARMLLKARMIETANEFGAAPAAEGTDRLRAFMAGKSYATSDPARARRKQAGLDTSTFITRTYKGRKNPIAGDSARQAIASTGQDFEKLGAQLIIAAQKSITSGARKATRQASPSKVAEEVGANIGRGAILGMEGQVDDAQQAGQQLAQSATSGFNNFPAEGSTPGTRGGKGRAQTAGVTTPGQPINYSILNGEILKASKTTASFGTRVGNAAKNLAGMSNMLGTVGIGISSLIGGLSMVEGPLGDLAGKLFPLTSAITGLTFAMQMLNAETIASIGTRIDDSIAAGVTAAANVKIAKSGSMLSKAFAGIKSVAAGLFRGILALLGPVGAVIAGFALLAGGVALLAKVMKDQKAKVEGLGDAAKLSGDKLSTLNEILGTDLKERQLGGVGGVGAEGTGARAGDQETQESAKGIQDQLLDSEDFKKEFKGTIDALKDSSVKASEQALTSMAVTLQTAGASEEAIAGIVNALLVEAGRTDVNLDFSSISIATAEDSAAEAARSYADAFANSTKNISEERVIAGASTTAGGGVSGYIGSVGDSETEADRLLAAGALSSLILDANQQMNDGLITIDEYNAAIAGVGETIQDIASTDASGLASASLLVAQMAKDMEAAGFEGIGADVQEFLDFNTAGGLDAASTVMSARAAGTNVTEGQMNLLRAGSAAGASSKEIEQANNVITAIEKKTARLKEQAEAQKEVDDAVESTENFVSEAEKQNEELQNQIDTYDEVSDAISSNNEIQDKAAFAQKIAADETLRQQWASAQLVDQQNGNTLATESFIAAMQEQSTLQDQINAQQAEADLESRISTMQEQVSTYEAATAATAGLVEQEEGQAIAYQISADAALSEAFAIAQSTDAKNGNSDATDALILKLKEEADLRAEIGELEGNPSVTRRSGGGGSTPTSFLDKTVKSLRNVSSAQTKVTKGFKSSLSAIVAFGKTGARSVRGLSSQLRNAGASEGFAEQLLGMDPDEWEKQKKQLFNFDAMGNITGMTAAGQAVQDALNVVEIGNFIDEQENITASVGNQITALDRLTAAGASYEVAYNAVKNTAFAAAIATAKSSAEIQAAAEAAMAAQAKMEELEKINEEEERKKRISEAVRDMNKEFSNQAKILDYINANRSKLSEAQIGSILSNKDLQNLVLEPNIDPKALEQALKNAQAQADMDVAVSIAKGEADVPMEDELSAIQDYFDKKEAVVNLQYDMKMADDNDLVKDAENQLAAIEYKLDDYNAELERISLKEDEINERYDKRSEALEEIADTNQKIAEQQQAQLDIADALSRGDIAAAAKAASELRAKQAADAQASQQDMLERSREAELGAVTGRTGMTRDQLEEQVKNLEQQMFEIEEGMLEPAQERIRLAELQRDLAIEQLELNGQSRQEFENVADKARLAYLNMEDLVDATKRFAALARFMETGEKDEDYFKAFPNDPANPANKKKPARRSSSGGGGGSAPAGKSGWVDTSTGKTLGQLAAEAGKHWTTFYNENRGLDSVLTPANGGLIKMAMGGLSMGSDTIPALLTPGEFVVRRPAVNKIGVDKLKDINNGTYSDSSVYNYNLAVNVKSDSDPNRIARAVMTQIKGVENQRIRGNKL